MIADQLAPVLCKSSHIPTVTAETGVAISFHMLHVIARGMLTFAAPMAEHGNARCYHDLMRMVNSLVLCLLNVCEPSTDGPRARIEPLSICQEIAPAV